MTQLIKGLIATPQDMYIEQPKEQEAIMKKSIVAALEMKDTHLSPWIW